MLHINYIKYSLNYSHFIENELNLGVMMVLPRMRQPIPEIDNIISRFSLLYSLYPFYSSTLSYRSFAE